MTVLTNLYSLLKIKENNYMERLSSYTEEDNQTINSYTDLLVKHHKLVDKIIKDIDPKKRKTFGGEQFNTQVILSNRDGLDEANVMAKYLMLTVIDYEDCIKQLTAAYSLKDDIMIVKSEEKALADGNQIKNDIRISYYNSKTKSVLDSDEFCITGRGSIEVPVVLSDKEKDFYTKYKKLGIDVFNPTHQAFRTKCYSFVDPDTEYDTTLSYRLNNYLKNRTECESTGCGYTGLSVDWLMNCDCEGRNSESSSTTDIDESSSILQCASSIELNNSVNIGLIVAFVLFALQIGLTVLMMWYRGNMKFYLNRITIQDCLLLDRDKETLGDYFNKRKAKGGSTAVNKSEEFNTSRNLKGGSLHNSKEFETQRRLTSDPLKLKENIEGLGNVEASGDNIEKILTHEIKIYNNYVIDKKENVDTTLPNNIDKELGTNTVNEITMRDYDSLSLEELLTYDNRSYGKYLWDNLVRRNQLLSIFFKVSKIDPVYIRVTKLIFALSLIFGTNAFLFTDSYIEQISHSDDKVDI
jgi:hypothetical protein